MKPFTERAIAIIQNIPRGTVMTYGQIAALAGSPRGARQVVRILHSMSSKYHLPWHRVINSKGEIGLQDPEAQFAQISFLEEEGVEVANRRWIDLKKYQYHPKLNDE
ncbi:MGMT family protein [Brevibacillus ginsengisoli]|uniref:MGMT family protein n=1 Tax=Brevibacillus ginsengisoli TaxID=363854 RepID=UPI003CF47711